MGIRTGDQHFLDVSIALVVICLTLYHFRWVLGLKRAQPQGYSPRLEFAGGFL